MKEKKAKDYLVFNHSHSKIFLFVHGIQHRLQVTLDIQLHHKTYLAETLHRPNISALRKWFRTMRKMFSIWNSGSWLDLGSWEAVENNTLAHMTIFLRQKYWCDYYNGITPVCIYDIIYILTDLIDSWTSVQLDFPIWPTFHEGTTQNWWLHS